MIESDALLILETLWEPDDLLWMGDRYQAGIVGDTIRTAREWIAYLQNSGKSLSRFFQGNEAEGIVYDAMPFTPHLKLSGYF
jgi:hypothetical protein